MYIVYVYIHVCSVYKLHCKYIDTHIQIYTVYSYIIYIHKICTVYLYIIYKSIHYIYGHTQTYYIHRYIYT